MVVLLAYSEMDEASRDKLLVEHFMMAMNDLELRLLLRLTKPKSLLEAE